MTFLLLENTYVHKTFREESWDFSVIYSLENLDCYCFIACSPRNKLFYETDALRHFMYTHINSPLFLGSLQCFLCSLHWYFCRAKPIILVSFNVIMKGIVFFGGFTVVSSFPNVEVLKKKYRAVDFLFFLLAFFFLFLFHFPTTSASVSCRIKARANLWLKLVCLS